MGEEPQASACRRLLAAPQRRLISAATLTEVLIVSARRGVHSFAERLIAASSLEVQTLSEVRAVAAANVYRRWGKGFHPARLNYGDCFAYALAREFDCPLLYVGDDFARINAKSALG